MLLRLGFLLLGLASLALASCSDEPVGPTAATVMVLASPSQVVVPTSTAQAPTDAPGATAAPTPTGFPTLAAAEDESGVTRAGIPVILAVDGGRGDCPPAWRLYGSSGFSVCYPPNYHAHTWTTAIFPLRLSVRLIPGEPLAYTSSVMNLWNSERYEPPSVCEYQQESIVPGAATELAEFELDRHSGVACTAEIGGATQFKGAVETTSGGFDFYISAFDRTQLELAMSILGSVQIID